MSGVSTRAWARVDLGAIRANVATLRRSAPTAELMAVVKADAYGHGLIPVAAAARQAGAAWLGVALLEEAIALRESGDTGPILAWLAVPGDSFIECVRRDVDLNVGAEWMLSEIVAAAKLARRSARVHLKAETGLGRGGTTLEDWPRMLELANRASASGAIEIVGIWSHLAHADNPNHPTIAGQVEVFETLCERARAAGIDPPIRHLANSAATLALPSTHYDLVRPGISIYGISPGERVGSAAALGLRPAMTFGGRIAAVKRVPAGHGVSYGHDYVTDRETALALVPIGYADGVLRRASGRGQVQLAGERRTIAGRVCMDQFVVDVGDAACEPGAEVILFGQGSRTQPTAQDWALACDTIAYEIVTSVGPRVPRVYVDGE